MQQSGTLDGYLLNTIEDDACVQGTRPEYVEYNHQWYVATADYGGSNNEVRLYDPQRLSKARSTSEPGVLVKKFNCSPWVQNLCWIPEKGWLLLIQNHVEGRKWRFTILDLDKSIDAGREVVIASIDTDNTDELEGFTVTNDRQKGIAVSSSHKKNINNLDLHW